MVSLSISPQNPQVTQRIVFSWSDAPYITLYYSFYSTGPWTYLTGPTNLPQIYYLVPSDWEKRQVYFRALDPTKNVYSNIVSITVQGAIQQLSLTVSPTKLPALQATEITVKVSPVDAVITILGPGVFRMENTVNGQFKTTIYPANSAQPITVTARAEGYLDATATITITMTSKLTIYVYDSESKPVSGATVELWGPVTAKGETDVQGNFTVTDPKEGTYAVKVTKSGYDSATDTFDLPGYMTAYTRTIFLRKSLIPPIDSGLGGVIGSVMNLPGWVIVAGALVAVYLITKGGEKTVVVASKGGKELV